MVINTKNQVCQNTGSYLETTKEIFQLLGREIPSKLHKHVMNILHDHLMLAVLGSPYPVQVFQTECLLLDAEPDQSIQLLHILGLMEVVTKHDSQHVVALDPCLHRRDSWVTSAPHTHTIARLTITGHFPVNFICPGLCLTFFSYSSSTLKTAIRYSRLDNNSVTVSPAIESVIQGLDSF